MPELFSGNRHKVIVSRQEVARFNARWPGSPLNPNRHYGFEFDEQGDLLDSDVPEHQDGTAALALAYACREFYLLETWPEWGIAP
jgi:hypothetical protein